MPVITLQLVVSVVFIQRHYEDVTEQMTSNLLHDIRLVLATVALGGDYARVRTDARLVGELFEQEHIDCDFTRVDGYLFLAEGHRRDVLERELDAARAEELKRVSDRVAQVLYEALGATFTELKVRRDPDCPVCSRAPEDISDEEMGVFPDYEAFCAAAG